jgi:two-component system response regulator AtoC
MANRVSVLIIEDHPVLAKNFGTYLRRFSYAVRISHSAEAGLSELETFTPDAILLDYNLPSGMNGLEALAKIRAIDRQIKVIMMTAYGSDELAAKAIRGGVYQIVTKPISVGKLKQILDEAVLDKPPDQDLF